LALLPAMTALRRTTTIPASKRYGARFTHLKGIWGRLTDSGTKSISAWINLLSSESGRTN
jgi:hypothetical protein